MPGAIPVVYLPGQGQLSSKRSAAEGVPGCEGRRLFFGAVHGGRESGLGNMERSKR